MTALQRFHSDNGVYPHELRDLVPEYLESIPMPMWGTGVWHYNGGQSAFFLSFRLRRGPGPEYYYSPNGYWYGESG